MGGDGIVHPGRHAAVRQVRPQAVPPRHANDEEVPRGLGAPIDVRHLQSGEDTEGVQVPCGDGPAHRGLSIFVMRGRMHVMP